MKHFIIALSVCCIIVWAFALGICFGAAAVEPMPEGEHLNGYVEIGCHDIKRDDKQLVCQVNLDAEDDDIKIFRATVNGN